MLKHAIFALICLFAQIAEGREPSPFEMIDFQGDRIEVKIEGKNYELLKIEGIETIEIVQSARNEFRHLWAKRIAEDFSKVMELKGKKIEESVSVEVRDLDTSKIESIDALPLKEENVEAIFKRYASGTNYPKLIETTLTKEELEQDLSDFEKSLPAWSYLNLKKLDVNKELRKLRSSIKQPILPTELAVHLRKFVSKFGDCHSSVDLEGAEATSYLPVRLDAWDDKVVGYASDDKLMHNDYFIVRKLDGLPLDTWLDLAKDYTPACSKHTTRMRSLKLLRDINFFREKLGLATKNSVTILASNLSNQLKTFELPLSPVKIYDKDLEYESSIGDGLAYLRIPSMYDRHDKHELPYIEKIEKDFEGFADAKGLIIDVRGNSGGARDILQIVNPHLTSKTYVANLARYNTLAEDAQERMQSRFLFPEKSYTSQTQQLITQFMKKFRPAWNPPASQKFSEWHYMIFEPSKAPMFANKPVVVLTDHRCFSACDIFVSSLDPLANVSIAGLATGGGSGAKKSYKLKHSGITYDLSTMVSYSPNGKLLEGNGVSPDVVLEKRLADIQSKSDTQLERAKAFLVNKLKEP